MVEALARPPTPPRTSSRMLAHDDKDQPEDSTVLLQTPGGSPFSANGSADGPSTRQSKRVNFSPWANYIKPPSLTNSTLNSESELKTLPPSNERKPSKSILKATNTNTLVPTLNDGPPTPESFVMLLESVAQQLAGESDTTRLDAYMHFFGALKTYEGVPGQQEISGKLSLITQFIQRDVTRNLEDGGPVVTNLVCQALKLSSALTWNISPQLPDDFKVFLVDYSINCLQDPKVPKSVLTHSMSILSTQSFGPKIMSNARLIRLLTALHNVTDRVNGNSVLSSRLTIYQRILSQSKPTFVSHSALWMEHLISGLLHPFKDTRTKAVALGFQTTMLAGPNPTLSRAVREIFDRPLNKGRKMVSEIRERMARMMASSESGLHIPQIWSIVTLLLRSKRLNLEHWEHFKEWVLVLQRCFNCSEAAIKTQAIIGWNRFVFAISPNETTSLSMIRMLSRPVLSQFERKKQDKPEAAPSQLALSSYYNLLYYAFHPSASPKLLDTMWEEYIASPSSIIFSTNTILSDRISRALSNMLWSSHAKVWTETKVSECTRLDATELPTLECKWVRSRITSILKVFEDLFKSSFWLDHAIDQSNIALAWISLSKSLSYASSKEITPTPETMHAVASVLALLQHLWNSGSSSLNATGEHSMDAFFKRFRFLSTTIISSLGSISFTEKLLLKKADETFHLANTPTHRDQRGYSNSDIPILHLLRLISDVSGISEPISSYLHLINGTLEAACSGRVSRGSRLELLRQCAYLYPNDAEFHFGVHNFAQIIWRSTAQLAAGTLCSFPMESARERDGSVSRDYETIVKILSAGLKYVDVSQAWSQLLDSSVRVVRTERGDQAIATMVLEPLAECATRLRVRDTYLPSISLLSNSLSISYYRPDASKVQKESENGVNTADNNELLVPEKLLALVHKTLQESYEGFDPARSSGVADFIESLTSFLGSGVLVFRSTVLERLQGPLAQWLKDEVRQLNVESGVESRILTACRALSSAVLNVLQESLPNNISLLQKFEPIICAGLESSHMSVAKRFMETLDAVSESDESLAYGESISSALQKLEYLVKSQPPESLLPDASKAHQPGPVEPNANDTNPTAIPSEQQQPTNPETLKTAHTAALDSSPVVKANETATVSKEPNQPAHGPPQAENIDGLALVQDSMPLSTVPERSLQRDEMFSMIEGLRSSSPPVITPKGFMTPPHWRNHRNAGSDAEPPLTPTLAAISAETEDVFLGSSPTPSTRSRPQAAQSRLSSSQRKQDINAQANTDPPSSPPELMSPSPNANQRAESPVAPENPEKEQTDSQEPQVEQLEQNQKKTTPFKESLTKRLRSASKKSTPDAKQSEVSAPEAPPKDKQPGAETANEELSTNVASKCIADSFNEDVESQVASQLEQDLEFAVDYNDKPQADSQQSAELPNSVPATRKRKRDVEEVQTPARSEKRRSARLSSSQPAATDKTPEPRSSRSKKKSNSFRDAAASKASPSQSASKKRKSQPKVDAPESTKPQPAEGEQTVDDAGKRSEVLEPCQKRRKSSRIGGNAAQGALEDTPSRKSSRVTRPRKQEVRQDTTQENIQNEERAPDSHPQETPAEDVTPQEAIGQEPIGQEAVVQEVDVQGDEKVPKPPAEKGPKLSAEKESEISAGQSGVAESKEPDPALPQAAEPQPEAQPEVQPKTQPGAQPEPLPEFQPVAQPEVQQDQIYEPKEQAPTETDVQMEEAGPGAEPEPTIEERAISQATQTEQVDNTPTERDTSQAGIIRTFEQTLGDLKSATLDEASFRQIDEFLFKIRVEAHDAFRRHTG